MSELAQASACCGGGVASAALIAGDEKAMLSLTAGQSRIITDVSASQIWRDRETRETSGTLTLEAAHVFYDRYQSGVALTFIERERNGDSSSGLGDVTVNAGYEYLPDWDYNPYRPKGIGYIQAVIPSGQSIYESENVYLLDSRGRGFWAVGAGTLLTKIWGHWDSFMNLSAHRSLSKSYTNSQASGEIHPGWGGALGFGLGYNVGLLRVGGALTWRYEDAVDVEGTMPSHGSSQRLTDANVSITYFPNSSWSVTLIAQDQTLFGTPSNTTLGRGLFAKMEYHFPR